MTSTLPELSDRDRTVIEVERERWKYAAAKDTAVLELLDLTPIRYAQVLNSLLDNPAAEAHDPVTVRRLRRLRDARSGYRVARRVGFSVDG